MNWPGSARPAARSSSSRRRSRRRAAAGGTAPSARRCRSGRGSRRCRCRAPACRRSIGAQSDRPRISLSSASFSWPYPCPPSSGPRWAAHSPLLAHLLLQRVDDAPGSPASAACSAGAGTGGRAARPPRARTPSAQSSFLLELGFGRGPSSMAYTPRVGTEIYLLTYRIVRRNCSPGLTHSPAIHNNRFVVPNRTSTGGTSRMASLACPCGPAPRAGAQQSQTQHRRFARRLHQWEEMRCRKSTHCSPRPPWSPSSSAWASPWCWSPPCPPAEQSPRRHRARHRPPHSRQRARQRGDAIVAAAEEEGSLTVLFVSGAAGTLEGSEPAFEEADRSRPRSGPRPSPRPLPQARG